MDLIDHILIFLAGSIAYNVGYYVAGKTMLNKIGPELDSLIAENKAAINEIEYIKKHISLRLVRPDYRSKARMMNYKKFIKESKLNARYQEFLIDAGFSEQAIEEAMDFLGSDQDE